MKTKADPTQQHIMLCTHFLCRTGLSILKCDELFWDGAGWRCKCEPKALQCSALEVQWWWLCKRVSGRVGISRTVTLHQRPFVFLPLKEGSLEPQHDSAFMHHDSHMPHQSPTLPSAPLLSTQAAKEKVTPTCLTNWGGFGLKHILMCFLSQSHSLLSICKPICGLLNACIVKVRP